MLIWLKKLFSLDMFFKFFYMACIILLYNILSQMNIKFIISDDLSDWLQYLLLKLLIIIFFSLCATFILYIEYIDKTDKRNLYQYSNIQRKNAIENWTFWKVLFNFFCTCLHILMCLQCLFLFFVLLSTFFFTHVHNMHNVIENCVWVYREFTDVEKIEIIKERWQELVDASGVPLDIPMDYFKSELHRYHSGDQILKWVDETYQRDMESFNLKQTKLLNNYRGYWWLFNIFIPIYVFKFQFKLVLFFIRVFFGVS